jgi:hypothetical protein
MVVPAALGGFLDGATPIFLGLLRQDGGAETRRADQRRGRNCNGRAKQ